MSSNNKIFRIAWDCDGVLAESHGPVLKEVDARLSLITGKKIHLTKSDLKTYNAVYDIALKLTENEKMADEIKGLWYTPELLRLSPPNPAAINVFNRCQQISDIEQYVITSRPSRNRNVTREWLEEHLPSVNWHKNLHIRQESDTVLGDDFKISRLEEINCMVEDSTVTVTQIHTKMPHCHVVYFSQPWNSGDTDTYRGKFRVAFNNPEAIYNRILEIREKFLSE